MPDSTIILPRLIPTAVVMVVWRVSGPHSVFEIFSIVIFSPFPPNMIQVWRNGRVWLEKVDSMKWHRQFHRNYCQVSNVRCLDHLLDRVTEPIPKRPQSLEQQFRIPWDTLGPEFLKAIIKHHALFMLIIVFGFVRSAPSVVVCSSLVKDIGHLLATYFIYVCCSSDPSSTFNLFLKPTK